ncbi:hypothetical protein [Pseudorhizobium marinum]|uniref:hypothetical protein n=1 Tax=Pseudorhizobium marinum TaxID=1496690 RepID=UPI0004982575|nr:hypothetical protein [Pseudorhizobium marinum]
MTWQKKYRWTRTWGDEIGLDRKSHEDYVGWDGDVQIGRIYLDQQTLKATQWHWAIQYPKGGKPWQQNSGWEETAAEAAKMVEECWDEQTRG